MIRILLLTIILACLFPLPSLAAEGENVKAGFIRDGDLWILHNNKEKQITNTGKVFAKPKWSHDGKWLLYQIESLSKYKKDEKQVEIWAYHVKTEK